MRTVSKTRLLARACLTVFVCGILALHVLDSGVNVLAQGISYFALGVFGWVFGASLATLAIGVVALVIFLRFRAPTNEGHLGLALMLLWAAFLLAGAIFRMDPIGAAPTLAGKIHSASGLGFLLQPLAAWLIESALAHSRPRPRRHGTGRLLVISVLIAAVLLLIFNGFLVQLGVGGAVQRLYWTITIVWLAWLTTED